MTFRCNFSCSYCGIRHYQNDICGIEKYVKQELSPDVWIKRLNDIEPTRSNFVVVLGNTELAIYHGFGDIVNSIKWNTKVYTNASTSSMKELRLIQFRDNLQFYVTYHSEHISIEEFIVNAKELAGKFHIINFHTIPTPSIKERLPEDKKLMAKAGLNLVIDHPYLITKPGNYNFYDRLGEWSKFKNRFASRVSGVPMRSVYCKTSFNHSTTCNTMGYPIAPNGDIYTCWRYINAGSKDGILGNFFDEKFQFNDNYYKCPNYGDCNACAWDKNIIDVETGKQLDTDVIGWEFLA